MEALSRRVEQRREPPERLLTARFVRVTVANFFFFLTFASFFLLPLHIRALGGSERTIGFAMGMVGISGLASVFVVGALLDRFGRRVFLLGGFGAMACISLAFLVVDRVGPALFVLRALQGLAFAAGFNAASTLAAEFAPPARRAAALGIFGVSTLITHALAPALGEWIIGRGGFATLFVVAAGFSVVGMAIAWSVPGPPVHNPAGTDRRVRFRRTPGLAAAIATVGCCGVAFGSVLTFVPTFAQDARLGPVATFFLSYTVTAVSVRLFAGGVGDARGHRTVVIPALVVLIASIAALAAVHTTLALAGAGLLFGTAQGLVFPTLNAFTVDLAEVEQLGRTQALYNGTFNLGTTIGALALGSVVQAFGHRVMFLCAAAMVGAALVIFTLGTRRPPDDDAGARTGP